MARARLFEAWEHGVSLGFTQDIPPSAHWPPNEARAPPDFERLTICHGSWGTASQEAEEVDRLLAEDIRQGFVFQAPGGSAAVVGRVGVATSSSGKKRLVMDSSISGTNQSGLMPNKMHNPNCASLINASLSSRIRSGPSLALTCKRLTHESSSASLTRVVAIPLARGVVCSQCFTIWCFGKRPVLDSFHGSSCSSFTPFHVCAPCYVGLRG